MWLEIENNIKDKPPYTVLPDQFADAFKQFMNDKGVAVVDTWYSAFRHNGIPYDFVFFRNDQSVERLQEYADEWNLKQRAAKRKSPA